METTISKGGKPSFSRKTAWIPPPALTSNIWKKTQHKQRKSDQSLAPMRSENKENFEFHLKELLQQIQQLKNDISFEQVGKADSINEKNSEKDLPSSQIEVVETLEKTIRRAIEDLKRRSEKEDVYQMNVDLMKDELEKKILENESLTKQQNVLKAKLEKVELNACDAIQHIMALKYFAEKFNINKEDFNRKQELGHNIIQDMFEKLKQLDRANVSLSDLIIASKNGVNLVEKSPDKNEMLANEDHAQADVNNVEAQLKIDRKQITGPHFAVNDFRQSVNKEKESLIKLIVCHKQRANRYLELIDTLKAQISHKNFEMNGLMNEVSSLKLQIARLISERDRLEIMKATLSEKIITLNPNTRCQKNASTQSEEISLVSSSYLSKIAMLEAENEKLKDVVSRMEKELHQCRLAMQTQNELQKMQNSMHSENESCHKLHESLQTEEDVKYIGDSSQKVDITNRKFPVQDHGYQITELWEQLQSDKLGILESLKALEQKLERSQEANLDFRKELLRKEDLMNEINAKLQEKIEENASLRQLLDSALSDARKFSEQAKETSLSVGQIMQSKLADLERKLQDCKKDNARLRLINTETEQKMKSQVTELQERLKLAEKSKKNMNDYIAFLKSSYANVFGDDSLAIKNYAL